MNSVEDVIVELHTDTGAVGYGEAPRRCHHRRHHRGHPQPFRIISPCPAGRDLDEFMSRRLQKALVHNTSAKAAVDMALWDLLGQKYSPVYRMLGGACKTSS